MASLLERFLAKVEPVPESGCWLWTGTLDGKGGYGKIGVPRHEKAHRVSWELHKGQIPKGMWVLHKCDIRCCVNPEHLFLGTRLDNVKDMHNKGRAVSNPVKGQNHGRSKLTETDVNKILTSNKSAKVLADEYEVSESHIYRLRRKERWRHLNGAS